ncbi:MAG: hypothetical protein ACJA08_002878 [Cyclobacteriaceae bacterium]|jgi:hypothetical protein
MVGFMALFFNHEIHSQERLKSDSKEASKYLDPALVDFTSSNLPILIINSVNNVEITKEVKLDGTLKIVFDKTGDRNQLIGPFTDYNGKIGIKGRGSSSWDTFPKKGYGFETRTAEGTNNNVSLLDMPEENDWILHGPYADKTLMKNAFVYQIGRDMGSYAPRTAFCELVLNDVYAGVYLLTEKVKRDKNRVDIANLNPEEISGDDLTGGYILSVDRVGDEYWSPLIDFNGGFSQYNYIYPDPTDGMPQAQKNYIRNYVTDFEKALDNISLSDTVKGYRAYVNVPSFIDYFIINELTKNIDAYRLSTYFSKDKDSNGGKLTMGPIWDHNFSCGGVNIGFGNWGATAENWIYQEYNGQPFWWQTFLNDTYYKSCVKKRWFELRETIINDNNFSKIIDSLALVLDEAKDRNFQIYPLGEPVWGNNHEGFTYNQEIDTLKGYLKQRMKWMDSKIGSFPNANLCKECFACESDDLITNVSLTDLNDNQVQIFPNPFKDKISFKFDINHVSGIEIYIYDLAGTLAVFESFELSLPKTTHQISIGENAKPGVYVYSILNDGNVIKGGHLIKL